jgi:hypothetical protein
LCSDRIAWEGGIKESTAEERVHCMKSTAQGHALIEDIPEVLKSMNVKVSSCNNLKIRGPLYKLRKSPVE